MPIPDDHARLSDLTQGEHMLLWAFRAAAFGVADCRLVRRQFEDACGPVGIEALTALTVFVSELAASGRRRVTLAAPGSYRLTCDEQTILALFASAQAEDYPRLEAHLIWLLADTPRAPFAAAACLVAQAFAMNGLLLRLPTVETAPTPREPSNPKGILRFSSFGAAACNHA
ncbi:MULTISPECIES: hypothetical protein [Phenylobacterium]|uniref:Uncharacterized protein n=1 Tax=Phenylobacterium koreense TaxID=266125 RepID=A0ABV2EG78_9CAUL